MNPSHCAPPTSNLRLSCYCFSTSSSYDIVEQRVVYFTYRKLLITETIKPFFIQFINFKYTCSSLSTVLSTEMGEGRVGVKRSSSIQFDASLFLCLDLQSKLQIYGHFYLTSSQLWYKDLVSQRQWNLARNLGCIQLNCCVL